jgi:NAD(P)-dependent dehydrogenase (short-subunit alcohol dehydrogenase family)
MGRAAAIAYAREGADVAINYFPTEESDAQEVRRQGARQLRYRGMYGKKLFVRSLLLMR